MIRKVKGGYVVVSHKTGKRLTRPKSKAGAVEDLKRIKYYANRTSRI